MGTLNLKLCPRETELLSSKKSVNLSSIKLCTILKHRIKSQCNRRSSREVRLILLISPCIQHSKAHLVALYRTFSQIECINVVKFTWIPNTRPIIQER